MRLKIVFIIILTGLFILSCSLNATNSEDKNRKEKKEKEKTVYYTLDIDAGSNGEIGISPELSQYEKGSVVKLIAMPDLGYVFKKWSGDDVTESNPLYLTMNSDKTITAEFETLVSSITGYVIDSLGGAYVEGAEITVAGSGLSTTSDNTGFFIIENVPAGSYDILISKPGSAGSRIQSLEINDTKTNILEVVLPYTENSTVQVTPPVISVTGIEKDREYTGDIDISIIVSPGSAAIESNDSHKSIYLKTGYKLSLVSTAQSDTDTLDYTLDTTLYPPGELNIKAVSYDKNNNRCEYNIPIKIGDRTGYAPGWTVGSQYSNVFIRTYTYGKSLNFLDENYEVNRAGDYCSAPDSTTYVDMYVYTKELTETGVNIYRSNEEDGEYILSASTSYSETCSSLPDYTFYEYPETSIYLCQGESVWYKFSLYNAYGESRLSDPYEVKVLEPFNLNLTFPGNNSTVYNKTPTFYWYAETDPELRRFDKFLLYDEDDNLICEHERSNTLYYTIPVELECGKTYRWQIDSYLYKRLSLRSQSYSYPDITGSANNGPYYFTVEEDTF